MGIKLGAVNLDPKTKFPGLSFDLSKVIIIISKGNKSNHYIRKQ